MTSEYPTRRALAFLEDPTLYFSLLVQDIRHYCLRPLLSHTHCDQPCGETVGPSVVCIDQPLSNCLDLALGQHGYVFVLAGSCRFTCWQMNRTDISQWMTEIYSVVLPHEAYQMRYDRKTDTVYFCSHYVSLESDHQLVRASQVTSAEEFHRAYLAHAAMASDEVCPQFINQQIIYDRWSGDLHFCPDIGLLTPQYQADHAYPTTGREGYSLDPKPGIIYLTEYPDEIMQKIRGNFHTITKYHYYGGYLVTLWQSRSSYRDPVYGWTQPANVRFIRCLQ